MFKVNNKDARRLYCYLSTYFTRFSGVSIVNFEHAIVAYSYCEIWCLLKFPLQVQSFFEQQMQKVWWLFAKKTIKRLVFFFPQRFGLNLKQIREKAFWSRNGKQIRCFEKEISASSQKKPPSLDYLKVLSKIN